MIIWYLEYSHHLVIGVRGTSAERYSLLLLDHGLCLSLLIVLLTCDLSPPPSPLG